MSENLVPIYSISELLALLHLTEQQQHEHFHMISFSDTTVKMPEKLNLKSENYFEITFSKKGNTEILIDGTRFKSNKNHFTFLSPSQSIQVDASEEDFSSKEGYLLFFSIDFLDAVQTNFNLIQRFPYFNINFSPVYFVNDEVSTFLVEIMDKMYEKFQNPSKDNFELIKSYLNILLIEAKELIRETVTSSFSRAEEITFLFENLLKQKDKKRQVKEYAESLFISPIYLSECVKKTTGKSAKQVITEYKIWEAKSLLNYTEKTIDEIAAIIGFEDRSNFINFFKKNIGHSPTKFRKMTF